MKKILITLLILLIPTMALAQSQVTINERLARLEEGQKGINQRIDDVNERIGDVNKRIDVVNKRFDDVNKRIDDVNKRFDDLNLRITQFQTDINKRFNWLYILISAIIALNGAMVGSVVWLARQERPVSKQEYDILMKRNADVDMRLATLERRFEQLEAAKG